MTYANRLILTVFCLLMGAFYLIWLGDRDTKLFQYYDQQQPIYKVTPTR